MSNEHETPPGAAGPPPASPLAPPSVLDGPFHGPLYAAWQELGAPRPDPKAFLEGAFVALEIVRGHLADDKELMAPPERRWWEIFHAP